MLESFGLFVLAIGKFIGRDSWDKKQKQKNISIWYKTCMNTTLRNIRSALKKFTVFIFEFSVES